MPIGHWGVALVGVALCAVGVYATISPRGASAQYGVRIVDDGPAEAFGAATGLRDIALGAILALLAVAQTDGGVLGGVLMLAAILPIGDLLIIRRHRSANVVAHLVHAIGAVGMIALGAWLVLFG
ncbi:DUF4267 domain-containing protein [Stackebrandtia soli]|uniref:DUF4267 domain-containing protein n=1 Tax=Stackebrandtia soli TaxID=1892856 RepID=UPI0039EB7097